MSKAHTKSQKRRERRRRAVGKSTSFGPDLPITGPACLYIVIPTIPITGVVGPRADAFAEFIHFHLDPWMAEKNMLTKGLAVKVGRGASIPTLMKEDLVALQRSTKNIRKRFRRWSWNVFGYGFEFSVGKTSEDPLQVYETHEQPGEQREPKKARSTTPAIPRAGRPHGSSSALN